MLRPTCLFAQYAEGDTLPPHTVHYLRALHACGFDLHVAVSNGRVPRNGADVPARYYPRRNGGLDFGAWQDLIAAGALNAASHVLLANDSVFGPIAPLGPVLERLRAGDPPVWGMVLSQAIVPHLQSWFVGLRADVFATRQVQEVFRLPFRNMTKPEIIFHGELGLALALSGQGYVPRAAWRSRRGLAKLLQINPMHADWRAIATSGGCPFVKTELLRDNPCGIPDVGDWRRILAPTGYPLEWIEAYLRAHPSAVAKPPLTARLLQRVARERPSRALSP